VASFVLFFRVSQCDDAAMPGDHRNPAIEVRSARQAFDRFSESSVVAGWGLDLAGGACCATRAPTGYRFKEIAAGRNYSIGLDVQGEVHV